MLVSRAVLGHVLIGGVIGGTTKAVLDAMQAALDPSADFNPDFYESLLQCMRAFDPELEAVHDSLWDGIVKFHDINGTADDTDDDYWRPRPDKECGVDVACGHYSEKNLTKLDLHGMHVCEPCNFASNVAYYSIAVRFCAHESTYGWNMPLEDKRAIVRGSLAQCGGSAFMHGSQSWLGMHHDTTGENTFAYLAHQIAIRHLPEEFRNNPILRDLREDPKNMTAVDVIQSFSDLWGTKPLEEWNQGLEDADRTIPDVSLSMAGIIGSLVSLILPDSLTNLVVRFIASFLPVDKSTMDFFQYKYLPMFRKATAHVKLGPLGKMDVARKGLGSFVKFIYALFWQEEIVPSKFFLLPGVNKIGAALLPHINSFADSLTGYNRTDADEPMRHALNDIYPGAGHCRKNIPHAKWHELTANAFFDLVQVTDYLGGLYREAGLSLDDAGIISV